MIRSLKKDFCFKKDRNFIITINQEDGKMAAKHMAIVRKCEPEKLGSDVFLLELEVLDMENFVAGPGQFIMLQPKHDRSVMPRSFSVVEVEGNIVTVLIKAVGNNTKEYSKLVPGEKIDFSGPHGSEIVIDPDADFFIIIVGGIGVAALISLAKRIKEQGKRVIVMIGAKTRKQISGFRFFDRYGIETLIVVDNENMQKPFASDYLLETILKNENCSIRVYSCGPMKMLGVVNTICDYSKCKCTVVLEEVMACGTGSCKGCAIVGKDGSVKHVCSDGPAFDSDWIDWEKFLPEEPVRYRKYFSADNGMKTKLNDVLLDYPTMNSSGCIGIDALENGEFDISKLGALVTKGVTVEPRAGNTMPRICETPAGMINSIGLENVGLEVFMKEELPRWLQLGKPVFVNISGFSAKDYYVLSMELDYTCIAGFEVNISCPNVKSGGIAFGVNVHSAYEITKAVRRMTNKIVIVKLTPNVTDIVEIAKAAVEGGADAISLINTVQAMAIDPYTRRPKIGAILGGLSGPAVRPIAVRMVYQLRKAGIGVPIIGMGGIEDGESAAEFFIAGADMVAVGTGGFSNRKVFSDINDGLEKILRYHGYDSIKQLVGNLAAG